MACHIWWKAWFGGAQKRNEDQKCVCIYISCLHVRERGNYKNSKLRTQQGEYIYFIRSKYSFNVVRFFFSVLLFPFLTFCHSSSKTPIQEATFGFVCLRVSLNIWCIFYDLGRLFCKQNSMEDMNIDSFK